MDSRITLNAKNIGDCTFQSEEIDNYHELDDAGKRKWLHDSLLFHMSLGSKELFHSNTWAWLIERDETFARLFFPDIPVGVPIRVTREERNRDLTIWINKGTPNEIAYVIENKFKSIPRLGQLLQYERETGAAFQGGVVTGIERPLWMQRASRWTFLPYAEISRRIKLALKGSSHIGELYKKVLIDYCRMIDNMCSVLENFLGRYQGLLLRTEECMELSDVRLEDLVNKLSAERFANWLTSQSEIIRLKQRVEERGLRFFILTDYLKKHAIVDVRIVSDVRTDDEIIKDHGGTSPWLMGVQIENDGYGRCFQVGDQIRTNGGRPWGHGEIFSRFNGLGWLPRKTDLPNSTVRRVDYGHYEVRGKYSFVYQPERLRDLSYGALRDKLLLDMSAACDFVERNDIQRILCG